MRKANLLIVFLSFIFAVPSLLPADINYDVNFQGVKNQEMLEILQSVSQLYLLRDHPPATTTGLTRRAEADIPNLVRGLQIMGYYDPKIDMEIDTESAPAIVALKIDPGSIYTLSSFEIAHPETDNFPYDSINPALLGFRIGERLLPKTILEAEVALLEKMSQSGYPLAAITNREVVADQDDLTIRVIFYVSSGLEAAFGNTTITGLQTVHESVIRRKIKWQEGCPYHPFLVEKTQSAIEGSGLFSCISVYPDENVDEEGRLSMFIDVTERKHHTVGLGISYNTQLGPGFTGEWENRNIRNLGEKLSARGEIWAIRQRGMLRYAQPDYLSQEQDLVWLAEAEREKTKGFTETFVSLSSLIDRKLGERTDISYGLSFKQLRSEDTKNDNGSFSLIKLPFHFLWNCANNVLDPTRGASINYKLTPTLLVIESQAFYAIQMMTLTHYLPLTRDNMYIFAQKISLGSIWGTSRAQIPAPERFYAGSENSLRGYRYQTVSPLDSSNDPIGGRSLMIYSAELRVRINEKFGWILFYDVGNVYEEVLPQFDCNQLNSIGFGFRYHTPVGPLRLDWAVPVNPRPGLDRNWELYISIGQSF